MFFLFSTATDPLLEDGKAQTSLQPFLTSWIAQQVSLV